MDYFCWDGIVEEEWIRLRAGMGEEEWKGGVDCFCWDGMDEEKWTNSGLLRGFDFLGRDGIK